MNGYDPVTIVAAGVGTISGVAGLIWAIFRATSAKHGDIYERINDDKAEVHRDYRSKDVCDERHEALQTQMKMMTDKIDGVAGDVKLLVRKNGLTPSSE